ncbi:hypothetical protein METBIDRAFT_12291 [Metschnikowia bicuspidata var. bicuspidata NRRL YB-4993]|uniref:Uncharacterized protein n=1 Tax=Metschnikowia bicuspidata var. bicuspidata NRRL YB-4993 TaxID=869754 RepID=A0A1A0H896_9ASCO|nr:hypothetical protein METBIDRAFT_12291 [Metschnikowia bicuspidata var. bicuspidata NRRL YB-4993]OBA20246.1 hypothetical protein METBIDRAFT_12291 [Metschnikowia bicuspidata var. bicuspidata NRRL YB-4993]
MAAKVSLAEKYALRQSQTSHTARLDLVSQNSIRSDSILDQTSRPRAPRTLLAEKYELQAHSKNTISSVPGAFGLPIKNLLGSPLVASEIAPLLYKSSSLPRIFTPKRLFSKGSSPSYKVSKSHTTGARVGQLARRITGFLASFGSAKAAKKSTPDNSELTREPSALGRSMADLIDHPSLHLSLPTHLAKPPLLSSRTDDIDEVDLAIRENKHKQEKQKLQWQLELKLQLAREIKDDYERRLYLQKRDFEAQIHALKEESALLKASSQSAEPEKKQAEFSSQYGSLVEKQNRLEAELEERSKRLAEKEALLSVRESEFDTRQEELADSLKRSIDLEKPAQHFMAYRDFTGSEDIFSGDCDWLKPRKSVSDKNGEPEADSPFNAFRLRSTANEDIASLCDDIQNAIQVLGESTILPEREKAKKLRKLRYSVAELQDESILQKSTKIAKLSHIKEFFGDFEECRAADPQQAKILYSAARLEGIQVSLEITREFYEGKEQAKSRQAKRAMRLLKALGPLQDLLTHEEINKYVDALTLYAVALLRKRELKLSHREINRAMRAAETISQILKVDSENSTGECG